ncbi:hypothetical protein ACLQ2P_15765 [Actinomadura citrea]|uniref:hypothetical protein n=1 Tax=Actinomadura citrea TaxID=46158 RepID=UPI003CE4F4D6
MLRAQYLGPSWDPAKVRGTPYSTGAALLAALDAGAQPAGHWSGLSAGTVFGRKAGTEAGRLASTLAPAT